MLDLVRVDVGRFSTDCFPHASDRDSDRGYIAMMAMMIFVIECSFPPSAPLSLASQDSYRDLAMW